MESVPHWDEFGSERVEDALQSSNDNGTSNNSKESYTPNESDSIEYGPALPVNFLISDNSNDDFIPFETNFCPQDPLPGCSLSNACNSDKPGPPPLPQFYKLKQQSKEERFNSYEPSVNIIGPVLLSTKTAQQFPSKERVFGPSLPPDFFPSPSRISKEVFFDEEISISLPPEEFLSPAKDSNQKLNNRGLFLPSSNEESDDEQTIGPIPPPSNNLREEVDYLARLACHKQKCAKESSELKREEWMLGLPVSRRSLNFLSSQTTFSKPSISSSSNSKTGKNLWTSTPECPDKDVDNGVGLLEKERQMKLDEIEEMRAQDLNKNREESLLEIHKRKRRFDETNNGSSELTNAINGRRPFDRDADLQIRGSGSTQMNSDEARERLGGLNSRFGHGSGRKFL